MIRFWCLLACSILLSSCRVERTPEHYIDNQGRAVEQARSVEADLRARIVDLGRVAQERNEAALVTALAPHDNLVVVGAANGQTVTDAGGLMDLLSSMTGAEPLIARDLSVSVGPASNVAWFRSEFAPTSPSDAEAGFSFTGTFVRQEGVWRLVQGHVSRPRTVNSVR